MVTTLNRRQDTLSFFTVVFLTRSSSVVDRNLISI